MRRVHDVDAILALYVDPNRYTYEQIAEMRGCGVATVKRAIKGYATAQQNEVRRKQRGG